MQCTTCHKQYTKKTLDKYRGLYCKPCFFDILEYENLKLSKKISAIVNENTSLQNKIKDLNKYKNIIYNDNNIIKYEGQMKGDYHGYGIYYDKKGIIKYKLNWLNNLLGVFSPYKI